MAKEVGLMLAKKRTLEAKEVVAQTKLIQQVMKGTMKPGEHYGKVPGCEKPSLFKPGAEKLNVTFRMAPEYEEMAGCVEEEDFVCFKIKCILKSIFTSAVLGTGLGSCNSREKKYKTRSVFSNKATKEEQEIKIREEERISQGGKVYKVIIVPQDPWDIHNTLYKMACKRALIAAVLNATAASDLFTQDIEDLEGKEREYQEAIEGEVVGKPEVKQPQSKSAQKNTGEILSVSEMLKQPYDKDKLFNLEGTFIGDEVRQVKGKKKSVVYDNRLQDLDGVEVIIVSTWDQVKLNTGTLVVAEDVGIIKTDNGLRFAASKIRKSGSK